MSNAEAEIATKDQHLTLWVGWRSERIRKAVASRKDNWQPHRGAAASEASEESGTSKAGDEAGQGIS